MNPGMRVEHTLQVQSSKANRAAIESKDAPAMIECARAPIARTSGSPSAISRIDRNGIFKSVDVSKGAVDGHIRGAAPEERTDANAQRRRYCDQRGADEYQRERGRQFRGRIVRILGVLAEFQESDDPETDSEQERGRADKVGDASGLRLKSGGDIADVRDLSRRLRRGGDRGCGNCKNFVHGMTFDFRLCVRSRPRRPSPENGS